MNTRLFTPVTELKCAHCGDLCPDDTLKDESEQLHFCCNGCASVYHLLRDNNLCDYYELNKLAGNSLKGKTFDGKFAYLDIEEVSRPLYDFYSEKEARITLYIPGIHCSSCIWLLENLHRVRKGVQQSRVQFLRKEMALVFDPSVVSLRQIVELMATLGYEPSITLNNASKTAQEAVNKSLTDKLLMRLGLVGFCLGNTMLLSFPAYLGIDAADKALYGDLFRWLNVLLSVPVVAYGASPFIQSAWVSLKQKSLNIDVPIALGILTLFVRSLIETLWLNAEGYYDSLAGLVFLLLIGRYIQQITYDGLNFQRNYKSYFPLAATVVTPQGTELVKPVNDLKPADILRLRPQELIPADGILRSEVAFVDYSFVTGEAEPQQHVKGEILYAGGRILQNTAELELQKSCSHSYLTQLWNKNELSKPKETPTTRTAQLFARYFTWATLGLATSAAVFWLIFDSSLALNAFTAVLVVACPCALTLSMPFSMGMAMAILGRNKFYVRNGDVIQHLAEIDTVVFDKTGTLTQPDAQSISYIGKKLSAEEWAVVAAMAEQSTHPLSCSIAVLAKKYAAKPAEIAFWKEVVGKGLEAQYGGGTYRLGQQFWATKTQDENAPHKGVTLSFNQQELGHFTLQQNLRQGAEAMVERLHQDFEVVLLTGDNAQGLSDILHLQPFIHDIKTQQKPEDKMAYIAGIQNVQNKKVLMVGDGLNDAGALMQAQVGVALTQEAAQFSPASDAIADAHVLGKLADFVTFARGSVSIVKLSFMLSLVYNFAGLSVAVSGQLSPLFAAIFMPLSSISVVAFGVGMTALYAKKCKL